MGLSALRAPTVGPFGNVPMMTTVFQRLGDDYDIIMRQSAHSVHLPRNIDRVSVYSKMAWIVGPLLYLKVNLAAICWPSMTPTLRFNAMQPIVLAMLSKANFFVPMIKLFLHRVHSMRMRSYKHSDKHKGGKISDKNSESEISYKHSDKYLVFREGVSLFNTTLWFTLSVLQLSGIYFCDSSMFSLFDGCIGEP